MPKVTKTRYISLLSKSAFQRIGLLIFLSLLYVAITSIVAVQINREAITYSDAEIHLEIAIASVLKVLMVTLLAFLGHAIAALIWKIHYKRKKDIKSDLQLEDYYRRSRLAVMGFYATLFGLFIAMAQGTAIPSAIDAANHYQLVHGTATSYGEPKADWLMFVIPGAYCVMAYFAVGTDNFIGSNEVQLSKQESNSSKVHKSMPLQSSEMVQAKTIDLSQEEKQELLEELLSRADAAFNRNQFTDAKRHYQAILKLGIENDDVEYAKERIIDIDEVESRF